MTKRLLGCCNYFETVFGFYPDGEQVAMVSCSPIHVDGTEQNLFPLILLQFSFPLLHLEHAVFKNCTFPYLQIDKA